MNRPLSPAELDALAAWWRTGRVTTAAAELGLAVQTVKNQLASARRRSQAPTNVHKSDAQLDAEAAAPLKERDLDAAIAVHRLLYSAETGVLKIHQRDGESGLGPPFNPIFEAFLDERYHAFPWSRSLAYLHWAVCRRTHVKHWDRPVWRGSLCYSLTSLVIRRELSVGRAQWELGLPDAGKTRRTLDSALLTIERRLETLAADDKPEVRREPAEWMAVARGERHDQGGLHASECPQCLRGAA